MPWLRRTPKKISVYKKVFDGEERRAVSERRKLQRRNTPARRIKNNGWRKLLEKDIGKSIPKHELKLGAEAEKTIAALIKQGLSREQAISGIQ